MREVFSANFGSPEEYDRTVVGDVVNVASRIEEGLQKIRYRCSLYARIHICYKHKTDYRPAAYVSLKAKRKSFEIFELFSSKKEVVKWKNYTKKILEESVVDELNAEYAKVKIL